MSVKKWYTVDNNPDYPRCSVRVGRIDLLDGSQHPVLSTTRTARDLDRYADMGKYIYKLCQPQRDVYDQTSDAALETIGDVSLPGQDFSQDFDNYPQPSDDLPSVPASLPGQPLTRRLPPSASSSTLKTSHARSSHRAHPFPKHAKKGSPAVLPRNKFLDLDIPNLPPALLAWRQAAVNFSETFTEPPRPPVGIVNGYALPDPNSIARRPEEFLQTYIKLRGILHYRLNAIDYDLLSAKQWHKVLGITSLKRSDSSNSKNSREWAKVFHILIRCIQAAPLAVRTFLLHSL